MTKKLLPNAHFLNFLQRRFGQTVLRHFQGYLHVWTTHVKWKTPNVTF